jgi:hypothetical protein
MAELESPAEPKAVKDVAADRADAEADWPVSGQARACRTRLFTAAAAAAANHRQRQSAAADANASSHSARTASLRCRRSSRTCQPVPAAWPLMRAFGGEARPCVRSSPGQPWSRVCLSCRPVNASRKQTLFKEEATCSPAIATILHYLTPSRLCLLVCVCETSCAQ